MNVKLGRSLLGVLVALGACCTPAAVMQPPASEVGAVSDYNRSEWGRWRDQDGDCQDPRQEVLITESLEAPTLDEKGCKVLLGRWLCQLTGVTFSDPRLLDIDHIVPLREAHYSGGQTYGQGVIEKA
ncbi:hypothetical protein LCGC14_3060470, partial [marine sediment metagenome]